VTHFAHDNPAEFASAFARASNARLLPHPVAGNRGQLDHQDRADRARCGLQAVYDFANALDAVVVSVGSLGPEATIARYEVVGEQDRRVLIEFGAVGELLSNIYDHDGRILDHPINQRVMSAPLESVCSTPIRVLAAGGVNKFAAIEGAIKLIRPTALVTDEIAARKLTGIAV